MDFTAHFVTEGGIYHAVPGQRQLAGEGFMHDQGFEMHSVIAENLDLGTGQAGLNHLGYGLGRHPHTLAS